MRKISGQYVFSPSDLIVFLESPFASWMDRYHLDFPGKFTPDEDDEMAEFLQKRGLDHEARVLVQLTAECGGVAKIPEGIELEKRIAATIDAMKAGKPLIYQAALKEKAFAGFADFLVKVPGKSRFGDFAYAPWDTKLARSTKPYHLIQLCCYAEMLEAMQGSRPEILTVVLGTNERARYRTEDFIHYYGRLKSLFLESQRSFDHENPPVPMKGENARRWTSRAEDLIKDLDHPCQVAGISSLQIRRLKASGITTMTALARTEETRIPGMEPTTFERLREQARLQVESRGKERPEYVVLPHSEEEPRGLSLLPPSDPEDVYFDMEGFGLGEDYLEYLFGVSFLENGKLEFNDWWAYRTTDEKAAFEGFVDWVYARWLSSPQMHIYHYGDYEVSALRRLMGKYGSREEKVDNLLRNGVFVNLLTVVRQGVRVGESSYSLKNLERLYAFERSGEVKAASDSMVEFAKWLDAPDGDRWEASAILSGIRVYNRADCESTKGLTDWLRGVQSANEIRYLLPAPEPVEDADVKDDASQVAESLRTPLPSLSPEENRVRELLGHLVHFHKRENKPLWWAYFDRLGMTSTELIEDPDCLGGLTRTTTAPVREANSRVFEYKFDPEQETKLHAGSAAIFAHAPNVRCDIADIDSAGGIVRIKLGPRALSLISSEPKELSLIPFEYVPPEPISTSILEIATACNASQDLSALPKALRDFLLRNTPDIRGRKATDPIIAGRGELVDQAVRAVQAMRETTLCIQGPPGTGKSYTAAQVIVSLLAAGLRVGISANSHEVINHLMLEVLRLNQGRAKIKGLKIRGDKEEQFLEVTGFSHAASGTKAFTAKCADANLVGGTAWAFSNAAAAGEFDYLFIDEAGQVSCANLVGMSRAARNIVLVGDQMQLDQPSKGSHPGESGLSCLRYLLQHHETVPDHLGIFLGVTRRLHPAICSFISESIYEGRLSALPENEKRTLLPGFGGELSRLITKDAGIHFIEVEHDGNSQSSDEEAQCIQTVVEELTGLSRRDEKRKIRPLSLDDILFVAPYNLQVRKLKERLGSGARVGSVDLFQGKEATVVVLSMCASTAETSPRGLEFVFNRNRLNVALSRAISLAVVIGSPALAFARCATVEKMRLVNLFCKVVAQSAAVRFKPTIVTSHRAARERQ